MISVHHPPLLSVEINTWANASLSDQDGDKKLTLSEFISLPVGTVENQQAQDVDDDWVRERKKEFEDVIDADKNGIVTMEELEVRPGLNASRCLADLGENPGWQDNG